MKRLLLLLLLFVFYLSLAGCTSDSYSLVGRWRITKSSVKKEESGRFPQKSIEFLETQEGWGGFNMTQDDGTRMSGAYRTSEKTSPKRIVLAMKERMSSLAGIYKFEGSKLILKIQFNPNLSDFAHMIVPADFSEESAFSLLELER